MRRFKNRNLKGGKASALLAKGAAAIDFVRNAFSHLKAIGVNKGGEALLKKACIERDAGVIAVDSLNRFMAAAKTRQWDHREESVRMLA